MRDPMPRFFRTARCLAGSGLSLAAAAIAFSQARAADERIALAPHRAVYDLTLDLKAPARGVDGAKARIAYDFTGDACEGYKLNFRQVTALEASESGRRVIDSRTSNTESGDGLSFSFSNQNQTQGRPPEASQGEARLEGGRYVVKLTKPEPGRFEFGKEALFPSAQIKAVIAAGRRGETTLNVPMFDGSDSGKQIYDTLSVIGPRIEGREEGVESFLRAAPFKDMPRWPVTISYFKRGAGEIMPSYRVSFELYENGVTRAVRLDYGDFALTSTFTSLDLLPPGVCAK